jgi:hypothetical protein
MTYVARQGGRDGQLGIEARHGGRVQSAIDRAALRPRRREIRQLLGVMSEAFGLPLGGYFFRSRA